MRKNFNIASNLGIAEAPSGLFIQPREIEDFPDEKVVVISTGSQGEPLSALRRMANNDHRDVELHSRRHRRLLGDAGPRQRARGQRNDRPHLRDRRLGGDRQRRADPRLRPRLAGGAEADAQPDQAALRAADPRRPPAAAAARRASPKRSGSTPRTSSRAATGCRSRSTRRAPASARTSTPGSIYVDGVNVGEPDDVALRDRREISDDGIFIVVATISSDDGSVVADPEVILRGVAFLEDEDALVEELKDVVEDAIEDAADGGHPRGAPDPGGPPRRRSRSWSTRSCAVRPMILPVIVEV